MKLIKNISTLVFLITLAGCTKISDPVITSHGYAPNKEDIKEIKAKSYTKQQVQEQFGVPFMVGVNNNNYWYYLSYQTTRYGFGKKQYKSFNLVELKFENNAVSFVKKYNEENLKQITFKSDKTSTSGKEFGVLEQIIGNIGKFRPTPKSSGN